MTLVMPTALGRLSWELDSEMGLCVEGVIVDASYPWLWESKERRRGQREELNYNAHSQRRQPILYEA